MAAGAGGGLAEQAGERMIERLRKKAFLPEARKLAARMLCGPTR